MLHKQKEVDKEVKSLTCDEKCEESRDEKSLKRDEKPLADEPLASSSKENVSLRYLIILFVFIINKFISFELSIMRALSSEP